MNSCLGKVKGVGIPTNIDLCTVIPQPTMVPMTTPEKELERTRADYKLYVSIYAHAHRKHFRRLLPNLLPPIPNL